MEILLNILEENTWLNPADVYRSLEIEMTKKGVREAVKNVKPFLKIDQFRYERCKSLYRVSQSGGQATFNTLMNLFIRIKDSWFSTKEFSRFVDTRYYSDNEGHILQYEKELEERMQRLKGKTAPLLKDAREAEMPQRDLLRKLNSKEILWNDMFGYWLCIESICGDCSFREECMKIKKEKYGDKILSKQLKYTKNREIQEE